MLLKRVVGLFPLVSRSENTFFADRRRRVVEGCAVSPRLLLQFERLEGEAPVNKIGISLASLAFWGMTTRCPAQDFRGAEVSAAMAKIEQMRREGKPVPPAPRLPDGHPDL